LEVFAAVRHVALYAPLLGEPSAVAVEAVAAVGGKCVYYPRVTGDRLEFVAASAEALRPGRFGIPEPGTGPTLPTDEPVLMVVPGLGFDLQGTRIGRGGGFYDRTLTSHPWAFRCGLAYEFQLLPRLPEAPWDVCMHSVVTDARVVSCQRRHEGGMRR
jgi:5-formyltetrahydrofolate cyclo-ligase